MEKIKGILNVQNFSEFKNIPNLKYIIVLCHILNTIRSSQRLLMLTNKRPDSPTTKRDIIYGLITSSCFTYEGMKTSFNILKKIASDIPKELHTKIAWLRNEIEGNKLSIFNTTLANIRNKIGFHFNISISDEFLQKSIHNFPPSFIESTSDKKFDLSYVIADNYIVQYFSSNDNSEVSVISLIDKLANYNVTICTVLDKIVVELINKYLRLEN